MSPSPALPEADQRPLHSRNQDTPCQLVRYRTLAQWQARAQELRQQILASAGLLPLPPRTALRPRIFGGIERDGYRVEKVYFESRPGYYVTGNLYRPRAGRPPFPGVLCPHGHWQHGRLEDAPEISVPGRCLTLARQGYVVFSYDMVGYNDSKQVGHLPPVGEGAALWGVSLLGLQLWNSMRAVDFLCSLPEVDQERLACTGASGGGTQTFLLTAVEDRIKVAAPVCMVSAHFQGGCLCENGPSLRLDTNNLEIAALAAPRPLLLVSATGDWSKNTPQVEYPWIRGIYQLYGHPERVANVHVDAGHNYNQQSREAVYAWFGQWLLGSRHPERLREQPFSVEPPENLLVFAGRRPPGRKLDSKALTSLIIAERQQRLEGLWPRDAAGQKRFRQEYGPALRWALAAALPERVLAEPGAARERPGCRQQALTLGRPGAGDRVPAALLVPPGAGRHTATLVVDGAGKQAVTGESGPLPALAAGLVASGRLVMAIDCLGIGEARHEPRPEAKHFTTYNRTDAAERVQDILTALAYLGARRDAGAVELVGLGEAGTWCLLARALAPRVRCAVDLAGFDPQDDGQFLQRLPIPLLRAAGDLRTAVALAAPGQLLLWNADPGRYTWATELYRALGQAPSLTCREGQMKAQDLVTFLAGSG